MRRPGILAFRSHRVVLCVVRDVMFFLLGFPFFFFLLLYLARLFASNSDIPRRYLGIVGYKIRHVFSDVDGMAL